MILYPQFRFHEQTLSLPAICVVVSRMRKSVHAGVPSKARGLKFSLNLRLYRSKEEGKDQESIQSRTTPYPRHHNMTSDKSTKETSHTQGSQEVSPFPAGDRKAATNRQDSIIITH